VDARACDCCQTAAVTTTDGLLVAYRDRSDQEIRDIVTTRFNGVTWSVPVKVAEDRWQILGCPVNGPALAAEGSHVILAWYTEALERPRVSVAISADHGMTFGPPVEVSTSAPLGRVQAAALGDGTALVGWVESVGTGSEFRLRRIDAAGRAGVPSIAVPAGDLGVRAYPRLSLAGDEVTIAWIDQASPLRLRTKTVSGAP
jgi:hypothetical protein